MVASAAAATFPLLPALRLGCGSHSHQCVSAAGSPPSCPSAPCSAAVCTSPQRYPRRRPSPAVPSHLLSRDRLWCMPLRCRAPQLSHSQHSTDRRCSAITTVSAPVSSVSHRSAASLTCIRCTAAHAMTSCCWWSSLLRRAVMDACGVHAAVVMQKHSPAGSASPHTTRLDHAHTHSTAVSTLLSDATTSSDDDDSDTLPTAPLPRLCRALLVHLHTLPSHV